MNQNNIQIPVGSIVTANPRFSYARGTALHHDENYVVVEEMQKAVVVDVRGTAVQQRVPSIPVRWTAFKRHIILVSLPNGESSCAICKSACKGEKVCEFYESILEEVG